MLSDLLKNKANKSTGDKNPASTREALRMKLKQKQSSRLSKHAINAQTEKKAKNAPQNDDTAVAVS
jgi:hypothetical protein